MSFEMFKDCLFKEGKISDYSVEQNLAHYLRQILLLVGLHTMVIFQSSLVLI